MPKAPKLAVTMSGGSRGRRGRGRGSGEDDLDLGGGADRMLEEASALIARADASDPGRALISLGTVGFCLHTASPVAFLCPSNTTTPSRPPSSCTSPLQPRGAMTMSTFLSAFVVNRTHLWFSRPLACRPCCEGMNSHQRVEPDTTGQWHTRRAHVPHHACRDFGHL